MNTLKDWFREEQLLLENCELWESLFRIIIIISVNCLHMDENMLHHY